MNFEIRKCKLEEILHLRSQFLQENDFQIRYNACHERHWSDSYLISLDNQGVGYGSVKGKEELTDRDSIFEFYLHAPLRKNASALFEKLISDSGAKFLECQTNDFFLTSLVFEFSQKIYSDTILFEDYIATGFKISDIEFRKRKDNEVTFPHRFDGEPGDYVLIRNGIAVATGGFLLHYNIPYADLYMEVNPEFKNQGFGSYMLQEVKKECYLAGRVPAARCNIKNKISRSTLIKAGMKVCGFMLIGDLDT